MAHGRAVLVVGVCIAVLSVVSATGLEWSENVTDLLPQEDPVVSMYLRLADRFRAMDYIFFTIGSDEGEEELPPDELIDVADELHEQLAASDLFDRIIYRWEPHDLAEAYARITTHRASLFTKDDAVRLAGKLEKEAITETLQQWRRVLTESPAPLLSKLFYEDPLGINVVFLEKLRAMQSMGGPVTLHEGRLFSDDLAHALIIALPRFPSTDSLHAAELIESIAHTIGKLERSLPGRPVRISYFGGHRASLDNAHQIKRDIALSVSLSVLAISVLGFLVYRRARLILLIFLPVLFGATVSAGLVRLFDPFMSAIVVGCGSMLVGISVDYAVHILFGVDRIASHENREVATVELMRRLIGPIMLSAATTCAAFAALHFSIMPGYRNLAHFGGPGILAAAFFSMIILPALTTRFARGGRPRPFWNVTDVFPSLRAWVAGHRLTLGLVVTTATLVSLPGLYKLRFEGDIEKLNSVSQQTRRDWDHVVDVFGDAMRSTTLVVQADDLQTALRRNEELEDLMRQTDRGGAVKTINPIGALLPSRRMQQENRRRWVSFWNDERVVQLRRDFDRICSQLRMRPELFERCFQSLPGPMPAITYKADQRGLLGDLVASHLSVREGEVMLLVRAVDGSTSNRLSPDDSTNLPLGVTVFSGQHLVHHMVQVIYSEFKRLGAVAAGLIVVILCLCIRPPKRLVIIMIPLMVSAAWTFGTMGWLGVPINLMNSAVVVFVFGLIVDYGIFLTAAWSETPRDDPEYLYRAHGAVAVSALTTLCGMGALLFAQHPALHAIGATAVLGIGSGLIAVFSITVLLSDPHVEAKHRGRARAS